MRLAPHLAVVLAAAGLAVASPALANKIADAETAFAENHDAQAVDLYAQAIAESASDPATQAEAYFGRGEVHAALGRTDMAIADFTSALSLKQDEAGRANTLFSRAESETRKRQYQAAADDYGEALKLEPAMLGAHFGRGRALRALNRNDEAAKEYDAYRTLSARADLLGLPQPKDEYTARRLGRAGD